MISLTGRRWIRVLSCRERGWTSIIQSTCEHETFVTQISETSPVVRLVRESDRVRQLIQHLHVLEATFDPSESVALTHGIRQNMEGLRSEGKNHFFSKMILLTNFRHLTHSFFQSRKLILEGRCHRITLHCRRADGLKIGCSSREN